MLWPTCVVIAYDILFRVPVSLLLLESALLAVLNTSRPNEISFFRIATGFQTINWNASKWQDMVDLTSINFQEPATTQHLSDTQFFSLAQGEDLICDIPDMPSHSQSVERSVKLVSDASHTVFGYENRQKSILAKLLSRKMRQKFISNGHYHQTYDELYS